ncbi:dual specificity protein phosphatase 3-like protein, partial [Sarcoptes scabiei]
KNIDQITTGQSVKIDRIFTSDDVEAFARLTNDFNPIHLNKNDAIKFNFPDRIVHGALINGFAALSKSFLKDIGVTHVLNCALNQFLNEVHLNEDYYRDTNIRFKGFELDDICSENITRCFEEANNFIDDCLRNGGKILIHCLAGVSRSATITIAYLMMRHAMTLEEAIKEVKQNRRICPNEGFLRQLVELDLMLNQQRHP